MGWLFSSSIICNDTASGARLVTPLGGRRGEHNRLKVNIIVAIYHRCASSAALL
jgi:hypothetical protein